MAELAFDDTEQMPYPSADDGLDARDLLGQRTHGFDFDQQLAQYRVHGHMPLYIVLGVGPLIHALVASIGKHIRLLTLQQAVVQDHGIEVSDGAEYGVHQTGICNHTDVRLHAEESLLTLLAWVHLRVTLTAGMLSRTRRRHQRGIDHCALRSLRPLASNNSMTVARTRFTSLFFSRALQKHKMVLSFGSRSSQAPRPAKSPNSDTSYSVSSIAGYSAQTAVAWSGCTAGTPLGAAGGNV